MEDETATETPKKKMSEEALARLAQAREKANARRKELAAERATQKEALILEKMEQAKAAKAAKLEKAAEKEAKLRVAAQPVAQQPAAQQPPPLPKKKKRDTVVVEYSSSDSDDVDFEDARVLFVKKERQKSKEPAAQRPPVPDPLDAYYRKYFGQW